MREGSGVPPWDASLLENEFFRGKSMHEVVFGTLSTKANNILITVCMKMLKTYQTLDFIFEVLLFTLSKEDAVICY